MNATQFISEARGHGIKLAVKGDGLDIDAPKDALTPDVMAFMKGHKAEIIEALRLPLAALLELPDGRRFWLAPDGMTFDAGGIPILRRSVMDKLVATNADVKTEIMALIDAAHELGGDLRMSDER